MAREGAGEEISVGSASTKPDGVQSWKIKISASWKTAAASILAVAKDLVDAETALKAIDAKLWDQLKQELHDEKIISEAILKKLIYIGRQHAMLIKHAEYLPPRYNAIYQLSHLTEQALAKLVEQKKLSPALEDREVAKLVPASKQSTKNSGEASADTVIPLLRVVQTKKRLSAEAKATLVKSLKLLSRVEGIELRYTEDGERYSSQDAE